MRLRSLLAFPAGLAVLLLFLYAGEGIVRAAGLPVPGSVVGMVLLFAALRLRVVPAALVGPAADLLLRHMGLLFVPPAVGVMVYGALLRAQWLPLAGASVAGTLAVLLVVGWMQQRQESDG